MEEQKKKYKHIFDYFDEEGKLIGAATPITDSAEIPEPANGPVTPVFRAYLGWCYEGDRIGFGRCFKDNVERDTETLQLKPIIIERIVGDGIRIVRYKESEHKGFASYEDDCEFRGIKPCEKYLKLKKEREEKFKIEWERIKKNEEYFREKYYGKEIQISF